MERAGRERGVIDRDKSDTWKESKMTSEWRNGHSESRNCTATDYGNRYRLHSLIPLPTYIY